MRRSPRPLLLAAALCLGGLMAGSSAAWAQPFRFEVEQPASGVMEDAYVFTLIKRKPYRAAWTAMMKGARRDRFWMPDPVKATSSPNLVTQAGGVTYTIGRMCKPHDCANNQFLVLFGPDARKAWGLRITNETDLRWFGDPGPLEKAILKAAAQSDL